MDIAFDSQAFFDEAGLKSLQILLLVRVQSDLTKNEFLSLLKSSRPKDNALMKSIASYPTATFFKEKLLVYAKIFPNLEHVRLTTKIIFQLADEVQDKLWAKNDQPLRSSERNQ